MSSGGDMLEFERLSFGDGFDRFATMVVVAAVEFIDYRDH